MPSPVVTGLLMLGYQQRRPWLWVVDLDERAVGPTGTRLPGNDIAVDAIVDCGDWYAVHTHEVVWSVPGTLDRPAVRIAWSFAFTARRQRDGVWVTNDADGQRRWELVALSAAGDVVDRMTLPNGYRLKADTPHGRVAQDGSRQLHLLRHEGTSVPLVASAAEVVAASSDHIAVIEVGGTGLRVVALDTGRTTAVAVPAVAEWQSFGSFSPSGRYLALGAYTSEQPSERRRLEDVVSQPYRPRPAVMALIDVASGTAEVVLGQYDRFAWTPAWSADEHWVVFGAPFESRRLYGFRLDERVLHTFKFRVAPVMPMLDVSGRVMRNATGAWTCR